jgi:ZIP family zinc transporter
MLVALSEHSGPVASNLLPQVLTYVLFPVAAMCVGGVIAVFRPPGARFRSFIQHFAAGLLFAAVAGELLPDLHKQAPLWVIIGFALGTVSMLAVKELTKQVEQVGKDAVETPLGLLVTVGVDVAIDGLLIGIGFIAGANQGILLTVALTLELLSLGLATSAALSRAGMPKRQAMLTIAGLALLPLLGAVLGTTLLAGLAGATLTTVIAFGCAALLYLATEELLTEAHEVPDTPLTAAMFFFGFLLLFVIEMLL